MKIKSLYVILLVISFLLYPILNQMPQEVHIIKVWFDDHIPFIPLFSIPYVLYIPYILFTLIFFLYFSRYATSITISFSFCLFLASLFYIFHQTTVPRPEIIGNDIFSMLVKLIYALDKPYNCFPSLHVTLSILSYLYWRKVIDPKYRFYLLLFNISIILSTLFIKQHYIPDVISGAFLAALGYFAGQLSARTLELFGFDENAL